MSAGLFGQTVTPSPSPVPQVGSLLQAPERARSIVPLRSEQVDLTTQRKYHPSSLSQYVLHHLLRSRLKSFLTLAVALGFTPRLGLDPADHGTQSHGS